MHRSVLLAFAVIAVALGGCGASGSAREPAGAASSALQAFARQLGHHPPPALPRSCVEFIASRQACNRYPTAQGKLIEVAH